MTALHTLGTAGHVDHGKTALVRALTGVDTDRLEEERRRGISIVLGYAELDLGDDLRLSVVDVPGHERFVRTMVGGASGIDCALVCVAADDGVMPQTLEHLAILRLLDVRRGVVALTKIDLVDGDTVDLARLEIEELLRDHPLAGAPIIPVSAHTGSGLEELRATLRSAALDLPERPSEGRARLPVDRVFSLHGIGTVVTGTLWSGTLTVDEEVRSAPSDRRARIRSLEMHGRTVEAVAAGGRVAVALVGVERHEIAPGDTLWSGTPAAASYRLDVDVSMIPDAGSLAAGARIEVLHGTTAVAARVVPLERDELGDGERGFAQLRLERPLAALRGDRVILRRLAPPGTLAGAVVLDPRPARHGGDPPVLAALALLREDDPRAIVRARLGQGPTGAVALEDDGLLGAAPARAALTALEEDGTAVRLDADLWIAEEAYRAVAADVTGRLEAHARAHPGDPVLPLDAVLPASAERSAVVGRLVGDGVAVAERSGLRAPGAAPATVEPTIAEPALAPLLAEGFATHRQADLVERLGLPGDDGWALLPVLEDDGRIVRLPQGLVVSAEAYASAVELVRAHCAAAERITLAQLRDATSSSRKVTQALLERMDADGITRRVGDERILRRSAGS